VKDWPKGPLAVALVLHTYRSNGEDAATSVVRDVAIALRAAGHEARVLASHPGLTREATEDGVEVARVRRLPEARLRQRGFAGPLTHLPLLLRELLSRNYCVVHAFSGSDALAAQLWREWTGGPVVFTPAEAVVRERLSDRRLRLWLTERAVERSDAVVAPTAEQGDALWRWLAVEGRVISPADADAHVRLYRGLARRTRGRPPAARAIRPLW
jgi:hypothetical protein